MTTRTAIAAGVGAVALAAGGLVAADSVGIAPFSATATETVAIPPCTAITARGEVTDPCGALTATWEQSNHNALATMAYYPKWKAASPGEYALLKAWGTSAPDTPEPTARSAFGALIRYHLGICRMWAVDLSRCVLP